MNNGYFYCPFPFSALFVLNADSQYGLHHFSRLGLPLLK